MVKQIVKDILFLSQKAEKATEKDKYIAYELLETLNANKDKCVGLAANMIGYNKSIICVSSGLYDFIMINPIITKKAKEYETEEGCLSLTGVRKTTRYENIEVEYYDMDWKKQKMKLSGWPAQICQHEMDHLEGILI